MGGTPQISADPITLLSRLHCTVADLALLCANSLLTDAATEMKPAELKETRGEQSQTDVLKRDYVFVFLFAEFQTEANSHRGTARVRVKTLEEGRMCVYNKQSLSPIFSNPPWSKKSQ